MKTFPPERIVCLTEETVETLYLPGEQDRIVGVSGYAVRPKGVRQEKPRVSAFTSADIPKILALQPDLVLTFSDLQADIAAALLREGIAVMGYNQRDLHGILAMIRHLGATVGQEAKAAQLVDHYRDRLAQVAANAAGKPRPRVYFEEWDDPMISGIGWVSDLIEIAGGQDVFPSWRPRTRPATVSSPPIRSSPPRPTSSSARGAARRSGLRKSPPAPVGTPFRPSATTASSRSSRPSSCNPAPRR